MALSDAKLHKIAGKPYDGPTELPDGQGLSARISPSGHRLAGILAVYDQHDYLDEQRAALEQWAAHIAQCVVLVADSAGISPRSTRNTITS